jgi:hypothetical protein
MFHPEVRHRRAESAARQAAGERRGDEEVILILLVIPLIIVLAAKDPQGMGHLVQLIITVGAKLLNAVATLISDLLGSHAK